MKLHMERTQLMFDYKKLKPFNEDTDILKPCFVCRLCGKEFSTKNTINDLYSFHYCDGGAIGIADFIGFRPE